MNQPEDEPIQVGRTEEKLSEKFINEDHVSLYTMCLNSFLDRKLG